MKITDLLSGKFLSEGRIKDNQVQRVKPEVSPEELSQGQDVAGFSTELDSVSISPLARQFSQFSRILADDEVSRSERVRNIKQQIADGRYSVMSDEVAKSVFDYSHEAV